MRVICLTSAEQKLYTMALHNSLVNGGMLSYATFFVEIAPETLQMPFLGCQKTKILWGSMPSNPPGRLAKQGRSVTACYATDFRGVDYAPNRESRKILEI